MRKNSAYFILLVIGLISFLTLNTIAQEKLFADKKQLQKVDAKNNVLQTYIKISSLPMNERRKFFNDFSAGDKANLFKLHLALQFVKRPNLTNEQKDLILETIPTLSSESYEKTNSQVIAKAQQEAMILQQKARVLFSKQEGFEIFANLGGDTTEIESLQKYQYISTFSMPERKDVFREAVAKDKSNFWKVHLALSLATQAGLSNEQQKVILEAVTLATPELYLIAQDSSEWGTKVDEPLQSLTKRALKVFSKEVGTEIFSNLGGTKPSSNNGEIVPIKASRLVTCNCSRDSDWCYTHCGGRLCIIPDGGCGTLWAYWCDGVCQPGL